MKNNFITSAKLLLKIFVVLMIKRASKKKYAFEYFSFYRVFRQVAITRNGCLHDSQRSANISPTPEERHSFEDGMYAL